MSCANKVIEIKMAGHRVRARLMSEENPEVVKLVCSQLPLTSFALHTNVSGKGIVLPTTITYTGPGHMVDRHPGAIYLFAQGQSIVITYGKTHESALVNKFAEVLEEDLMELMTMGNAVYEITLAATQHKVVDATVRLFGNDNGSTGAPPAEVPALDVGCLKFDGGWRTAEAILFTEARRALVVEPDEIVASFAGFIPSGMGTGGNVLPVWMHQWCCLMTDGPQTLHRFLSDSEFPGMTLEIMVQLTRNHLLKPFNHFEFLSDLGLTKFKVWGHMYSSALGDLNSIEDYQKLTVALLTLVNIHLRRVQSRFPFYLGKSFPRNNKLNEEI